MTSPILILDGGLGTSLEQKYGCRFDHSTPLWSSDLLVSDPARLRRCQADFGQGVPVDVLLTATYQVSEQGFAGTRNLDDTTTTTTSSEGIPRERIPHYIERAIAIGAEAKTQDAKLALSVGPYGACMVPSQEYSGAYDEAHGSEEALRAWHADRLALFAAVDDVRARVAYVALETVPRVDEIRAMRRALSACPALSSLPCWISCLFPGDEDLPLLPDGSSVETAVRAMLDPAVAPSSPWGVGINCTKVHKVDGLVRRYEAAVEAVLREGTTAAAAAAAWPALVLYPDGTNGEVYNTATQTWEVPEGGRQLQERVSWAKQLAEVVRETRSRGAGWKQILVGGCCMAGAEDIAALRAELL
ncbi:hypothetical protein PWT90_00758 [Aphanocladium album]|nr:hypothetical protein PWT90_00758 [Aphanocladium album]